MNSSFNALAGYEQLLASVITGQVTDAMLMNASFIYPENTPTTKEAYYYRTIFEKFFPKVQCYSFLVSEFYSPRFLCNIKEQDSFTWLLPIRTLCLTVALLLTNFHF